MTYPGAIWFPGPLWKKWPETNARAGVVLHSAEGYRAGLEAQIQGDAVSWHFSVLKDGAVWQHYGLEDSCWHAGSRWWNQQLIGIEHEGLAGEPLTDAQLQASVELVRWIAETCGWAPSREYRNKTLWGHSEISLTQCPSGRIPWERYTLPRNAEFVIPEEDEVKVRELDQAETIEAFEDIARNLGPALTDRPANWWETVPLTVVEVTEGSPRPIPPGGRALLFITKD